MPVIACYEYFPTNFDEENCEYKNIKFEKFNEIPNEEKNIKSSDLFIMSNFEKFKKGIFELDLKKLLNGFDILNLLLDGDKKKFNGFKREIRNKCIYSRNRLYRKRNEDGKLINCYKLTDNNIIKYQKILNKQLK